MIPPSTDRRDFIRYPTNRVVGTVGDAGHAQQAVSALIQAGFAHGDIDILHGEEALHRLDLTGAEHGFLAQFHRTLIRTFELEEFKHLIHHHDDVRAGRFVIMVLAKRRGQRMVAADILHRFGAEYVGFYGRWAWEELPPTANRTPEEIPAAFARAWNERNADALAALFDADADFVNVDGALWHDRESIRKGHVQGLERNSRESTLATDGTTVKLLSPEIAVVHARMTLSDSAPAGTVTPSGPRTTIVSFVVHRAGDRWLCAAAHTTDFVSTPVIDTAGVPVAERTLLP